MASLALGRVVLVVVFAVFVTAALGPIIEGVGCAAGWAPWTCAPCPQRR